jgi:hypothetical protein
MPMPPPRALRAPRRSIALPKASVSLGTPQGRLLVAVDRLIRDEGRLYRYTDGYRRIDMRVPFHRALLATVREDMSILRSLRRGMNGLGAAPLFMDPKKPKFRQRVSLSPPTRSALLPSRPLPGAVDAQERSDAARQKAKIDTVVNSASRLMAIVDDIEQAGQGAQPIIPGRSVRDTVGAHWTESINFRYETPRRWIGSSGIAGGSRELYMRNLLRALPAARGSLRRSVRQLALSGLGQGVTHSDSSPLLWLLIGITAGYVMFNAATA